MVQSRSPNWVTAPVPSPRTCTSTWRAAATSSSAYKALEPNAAWASEAQRCHACSSIAGSVTARMPRPPPPDTALTMMPPGRLARKSCACGSVVPALVPRGTGTPSAAARARASTLSPNRARTAADGPTKVSPASAQAAAKAAFSLRKP